MKTIATDLLEQRKKSISDLAKDSDFLEQSKNWVAGSMQHKYVYNFDWLGRPVIQFPQDMIALQEIVWVTKPDLIIETGIAHGGSLIQSASLLALLDFADAKSEGSSLDPQKPRRKVVGIDIEIRRHNRNAIEAHPLSGYVELVEGSSIDGNVIQRVKTIASAVKSVMVLLDSNHTHEHVLEELEAYAPMVTAGCYCVVFDTFVEHLPKSLFQDRPWGPGNNPMTAVHSYLSRNQQFEIDRDIHTKLMLTSAPDGYLRRTQ